jgi:2-polyprenyl-6-methoxyphenol hydroxylase-like FAD-dependent oxidoreductase
VNDDPRAEAEPSQETILVLGAGMAGLSLALALEGSGKRLVIVERDPEPPAIAPHEAFESWKRSGVAQFRHPHVFVGRLHGLLCTRYPQLFAELTAAGFRGSPLAEHLPPGLREGYPPHPDDVHVAPLYGRRPTFEYVLRRHVGRFAHVRFEHGATAQGLLCEGEPGALRVVGLEIKRGDVRETLRGDVVVDAAGKNSPVAGWLEQLGVAIKMRNQPSQLSYFCRHYRLRDGEVEPEHRELSADLDYLKYAIFYAERGHFAIAFGCAEDEPDLVDLLRRPEGFESMCQQIPGLARWVSRAEPVTKVLGAGKIANRWTHVARESQARGLFLLGDAAFEANPIYGRGCAAAFVQSHVLAEALVKESQWSRRAARFRAGLQAEIYPHHRASGWADRLFRNRAQRARGKRASPWQWFVTQVYERVVVPAVLVDLVLAREILLAMAMDNPAGPIRVARFLLRIVRVRLSTPGNAALLLPPIPDRVDLLERVTRRALAGPRAGTSER